MRLMYLFYQPKPLVLVYLAMQVETEIWLPSRICDEVAAISSSLKKSHLYALPD
jgi:hypothetical protein